MAEENTCKAILSDKRIDQNPNGNYSVAVTCSNCNYIIRLPFSGWTEFVCINCKKTMLRRSYYTNPNNRARLKREEIKRERSRKRKERRNMKK